MKKIYFTYEDIHKIIFKISVRIKNDNWEPDCIVAIASGGLIPSRILRNFIKKDIYVIGLKKYDDEKDLGGYPLKIQWIDEVEKKITGKKILLVDEVDDTRLTLAYSLNELLKHNPAEIRAAIIHKKIKEKKGILPDKIVNIYYGNEIEDLWICYPWEAKDIDEHYKLC